MDCIKAGNFMIDITGDRFWKISKVSETRVSYETESHRDFSRGKKIFRKKWVSLYEVKSWLSSGMIDILTPEEFKQLKEVKQLKQLKEV